MQNGRQISDVRRENEITGRSRRVQCNRASELLFEARCLRALQKYISQQNSPFRAMHICPTLQREPQRLSSASRYAQIHGDVTEAKDLGTTETCGLDPPLQRNTSTHRRRRRQSSCEAIPLCHFIISTCSPRLHRHGV